VIANTRLQVATGLGFCLRFCLLERHGAGAYSIRLCLLVQHTVACLTFWLRNYGPDQPLLLYCLAALVCKLKANRGFTYSIHFV
jgi:hypothetical protein